MVDGEAKEGEDRGVMQMRMAGVSEATAQGRRLGAAPGPIGLFALPVRRVVVVGPAPELSDRGLRDKHRKRKRYTLKYDNRLLILRNPNPDSGPFSLSHSSGPSSHRVDPCLQVC